jgi:hypothetical protein
MIYKSISLLKAEAVVNLVMCDAELICSDEHIIVESYQNGREQGLTLTTVYRTMIYIAQQRNSDSIVVYVGESSMQSLSEDAYTNGTCFSDVGDAAVYVKNVLKRIIAEDGEKFKSIKEPDKKPESWLAHVEVE